MDGRGMEEKEGNWVKCFINPVVGQYLPSGCVWWLHEIRQNLTVGSLVPRVCGSITTWGLIRGSRHVLLPRVVVHKRKELTLVPNLHKEIQIDFSVTSILLQKEKMLRKED